MSTKEKYSEWLENNYFDEETKNELIKIKDDKKEIEDRFYKELEFGTGGLRGIIGAGTNRMNKYTVRKATQGLANFINEKFSGKTTKSVAISYDSRHMSKEFAEETALVFAGNNIKAYLFDKLNPVPLLSYAVRYLKADAGVMITASHNPKEYNGYKAYGNDGAQLSPENSDTVIKYVENVGDFKNVKITEKQCALDNGYLEYIGEIIEYEYIETINKLIINKEIVENCGSKYKLIFTPLHGTGNIPVRRILKRIGMDNVLVVEKQELPDPDFSTVKSPNPEEKDAFKIALKLAEKEDADIIIGTDPDCDRIGVVTKDNKGDFLVLSGNQTGCLITEYILSQYTEKGIMPKNPFIAYTIVTSRLGRAIADFFNVEIIEVLTGFKFIGEKILELDENGDKNFIFGFEESFGYLMGTHARDKDAVVSAMIITEMFLYYKNKNMTLYDALITMYEKYGYYKEGITAITLKGKEGLEKINKIMNKLRTCKTECFGNIKTLKAIKDYKNAITYNIKTHETSAINLPLSDVLYYELENDCWFCVRPSGTEPKIKIYYGYKGRTMEESDAGLKKLEKDILITINE